MKKNDGTVKIAVGSLLALTLVAAGISGYQNYAKDKKQEQEQVAENETEDFVQDTVEEDDINAESEYADVERANSDKAEALLPDDKEPEQQQTAEKREGDTQETSAAAETPVKFRFSEDSVMEYPVTGQVLLDYSMDGSIYFPTLEVYKYNPAVVLAAEVGTPVKAAATGKILSVTNDPQTGTTVKMDIGNGYQLTYGQMGDLTNIAGNVVKQGEILGYVAEPTKYYVEEGSNLYFAMTKDGKSVDPFLYMETSEEE